MEKNFAFRCYSSTQVRTGGQWVIEKKFTGYLDNYESVIWTNLFAESGDCEITMAINNVDFTIIDVGFIVVNPNKVNCVRVDAIIPAIVKEQYSEACIITSKTVSESDGTVTFKGKTLDFEWDARIINSLYEESATQDVVSAAANVCVSLTGTLSQSLDTGRGLDITSWNGPGGYLTFKLGSVVSLSFKSGREALQTLYDTANSNLSVAGVSGVFFPTDFRLTNDADVFQAYSMVEAIALDRTQRRILNGFEIEPVIFSTTLDNVFNVAVEKDNADFKNVAFVAGEGEGNARVKVWAPSLDIGLGFMQRRELFVDARNMRREDYSSDAKYQSALRQFGLGKLIEQVDSYAFEIPPTSQYIYGTDFYLGDTVLVRLPDFDVNLGVKVSAATETFSRDGYNCELTFGDMKETLSTRLNKKFGN